MLPSTTNPIQKLKKKIWLGTTFSSPDFFLMKKQRNAPQFLVLKGGFDWPINLFRNFHLRAAQHFFPYLNVCVNIMSSMQNNSTVQCNMEYNINISVSFDNRLRKWSVMKRNWSQVRKNQIDFFYLIAHTICKSHILQKTQMKWTNGSRDMSR